MAAAADECFVFPDTNILLGFKPLEELDLRKLVGAEAVCVVVTRTLVRELDVKKREAKTKQLQERAAARLRTIAAWKRESKIELRRGVRLEILERHHGKDLREMGLDPGSGDDHLIAEIVTFGEARKGSRCVLLTEDTGPTLWAPSFGIEVFVPIEKDKLIEEDQNEKRAREATAELARLKVRLPDLKVTLPDGQKLIRRQIPRSVALAEEEIQGRLVEANTFILALPLGYRSPAKENSMEEALLLSRGGIQDPRLIPDHEIETYNQGVVEYRRAFEEYLRTKIPAIRERTISFELTLRNDGGAPATGIRVTLTFPQEVTVSTEQPKPPPAPQPPARPKSALEKGRSAFEEFVSRPLPDLSQFTPKVGIKGPFMNIRGGAPEVVFTADTLDHKKLFPLPRLYVTFASFDAAKSFAIACSLYTVDLPDAKDGEIPVVLEKDDFSG